MTARVELRDWLDAARSLTPSSIDFLYADPPFNTGQTQRTPPNASKRPLSYPLPPGGSRGEGSDARPHVNLNLSAVSSLAPHASPHAPSSYPDSWPDTPAYIAFLRDRLTATLPALKPSAIIAIHCDFRASHHIRLLLDDLLGPHNFVNHLIWHYGLGGSSPRRFARKHDDILVYCLDQSAYYFDPPRVPATSNRMRGKTKKATDVIRSSSLPLPASGRGVALRDGEGLLPLPPLPSSLPPRPASTSSDVATKPASVVETGDLDDPFADSLLNIPSLNNMSRERTGYPTQKPLALLELLIRAFCPPDGLVLDPCCGSGTTLVAAARASRNAVGFDVNPDAVAIAQHRLRELASSADSPVPAGS